LIVTNRERNRNFPSREDERREIQGPTPLFYFKSLCVTLRQLFDITDRRLIYVSIVPRLRLASLNKVMLEVEIWGGGGVTNEDGGMDTVFSSINIFSGEFHTNPNVVSMQWLTF
jgi:hypothetical protein